MENLCKHNLHIRIFCSTFAAKTNVTTMYKIEMHKIGIYKIVLVGLLAWVAGIIPVSAETLRVVSYNVENLFHPKHDTIIMNEGVNELTNERIIEKDDYEWTPEGERRWSYTRYYRKVENIARVLIAARRV